MTVLRYFPSTVGRKCLYNEIAENFKKKIGTLGCEQARSWYSKFNIKQKLVFPNHVNVSRETFSAFFSKKVDNDFEPKIYNCILCVGGTFWANIYFSKIMQLTQSELANHVE